MSFFDRIAAAVTPAASDEKRAQARSEIERHAAREPWLRMIVDQHKQIEHLFAEAKSSTEPADASRCVEELAALLTGHATAEETVLYPELADYDGKTHAGMGYEEHAMTKVQLAQLRDLQPNTREWREKLEHVESAVEQHVYQEEHTWLPELVDKLPEERKRMLADRYRQQFARYCGAKAIEATFETSL